MWIVSLKSALLLLTRLVISLDSVFCILLDKNAREIMEASIKAVRGDVDLSERSDDYVTAMFDTLAESPRADSAATEELT